MIDEEEYREYFYKKLDKEIESGKRNFALYPNGEIADLVKRILYERYNIEIKFAVDNKIFNGSSVFSLEQVKEQEIDNIYFLICSDRKEIYDIIRKQIYSVIPTEQVIDLFSEDECFLNELEQETIRILEELDLEIAEVERQYAGHKYTAF